MFSARSYVPEGDTELQVLQRNAPRGWLDLAEGNPTRVGLPRADYAAILGRHAGPYVPDARGWLPARRAVCELYRERDVPIGEESVLLYASTSEAYAQLLMALCDPGDAILIPEPSYPLFEHLARLQGVEVRRFRLAYDGAWHIDFDSIRRGLDPSVRALFLVSPNNPTGSFLKSDELDRLHAFGCPVVLDEVFRPYAWASFRGRPAEALRDPPVLTFVLDGLSKRIGAPELKLSWMVVAGPDSAEALRRLEWISDNFLSVSGPVQRALPELLEQGRSFQTAVRERVERNLSALAAACAGSVVTPLHGEGGWYATVRLPSVLDETGWLGALLAEGIGPQPGWLYDYDQSPLFVLSLLPPEDVFRNAMETLVSCATRRSGG
jgi:aspartate/methionine/tyrosine aminotransferase